MRRICETCNESYNDEFHSTICPHKGIGFCRKCDCVVCVCVPKEPITATIGAYADYIDTDKMPAEEREAFLRALLGKEIYELAKEAK